MSPQNKITRRQCMHSALIGSFLISGKWVLASPSEAKAEGFLPTVLKVDEISVLENLSEALVPGSTTAGIGAYVDHQLSQGDQSLLMAKYLNVVPSDQPGFYSSALASVALALKSHEVDQNALIEMMASDSVKGWDGPPASFFLFLVRADGLDVTYGTEAGANELGIPYGAHISPETSW